MRTKSGDKSPHSQKMHVATVLCAGEVRLLTAAISRQDLTETSQITFARTRAINFCPRQLTRSTGFLRATDSIALSKSILLQLESAGTKSGSSSMR